MNINKYKKLILLLIISIAVIIIYIQYLPKYEKNPSDFVLLTNNLTKFEEDLPEVPLTWKETDQKLFNLDFEFVIKSHICYENSNKNIIGVIIVTSYFGDVELRSAMRRSFSTTDLILDFKLLRVFLLGLPPAKETSATQKQVENEAERFGDIVQGNFLEAYRNLTYKHLMGLLWASDNCKNVEYIMKMDDDIVVNMYSLQKDIIEQYLTPQRKFLAGFQLNKGPVRNSSSKWYVSELEYPEENYPPYLSGWFYITTLDTARGLVHIGRKMTYFWIDDVFINGIVADRLGIKHTKFNYFYAMDHLKLKCCMDDIVKNNRTCRFIFGPNGGDNNLFYNFNSVMKRCSYNNKVCVKDEKNICDDIKYNEKNFERYDGNGLKKADGSIEIYKL